MIARSLFVQYVREALADLHNPARLEMNPLANLLTRGRSSDLAVGQALRQILREAIETLRPGPEVPPDHPEWLGYHLLHQRYLQGISQVMTCERLGLSRATYYRRHHELAKAVAGVLWSHYQRQKPAPAAPPEDGAELSPDERAREEAVKLAREAQQSLLDPDELLQSAVETIQPFARQQGIELGLRVPAALPAIYGDPAAFRQIILNVLTEGITLAAGSSLDLLVSPGKREMHWQLRGLDKADLAQRSLEEVPGFAVSRALLEVYGGRLWLDEAEPEGPVLCVAIPVSRPQLILVIDDDADTVNLYRCYLEIHGYILQAASGGAQAWAILAESRPDAILLDVLMPREDGWAILQRLKALPGTADIPVVICSVLSQPQLALALGAAQVLRKPITADALLQALRALLAKGDS